MPIDEVSKAILQEIDKPKFYADTQTLKESSGYYDCINTLPYDCMNALPTDSTGWVENCTHCKVPMVRILMQPTAVLESALNTETLENLQDAVSGIVFEDKKQWSKSFKAWIFNPIVTIQNVGGTDKFWLCTQCHSIWVIVENNFWTKVKMNGETTFALENIKTLEGKVTEPMIDEVIDPGEKPSEDSTLCPNCKVYRSVEPYDGIIGKGEPHVQHVCPKCHAVDLVPVQIQSSL